MACACEISQRRPRTRSFPLLWLLGGKSLPEECPMEYSFYHLSRATICSPTGKGAEAMPKSSNFPPIHGKLEPCTSLSWSCPQDLQRRDWYRRLGTRGQPSFWKADFCIAGHTSPGWLRTTHTWMERKRETLPLTCPASRPCPKVEKQGGCG